MAKKPKPTVRSKKHLARLEIERRQTMAVRYTAIAVVVIVALLIGYSILDMSVLQPKRAVATVDGEVITVRDMQIRTRMQRQNLINTYINYVQFSQLYGFDLSQQMQQLEFSLNSPQTIGLQAVESLIDDIVLKKEAEKLGITISETEITKMIEASFEYFPNGAPTATVTPTPPVFATLSAEQLAMVTPTATIEPLPTAEPTDTSAEETAPTPTPFPNPTATPYTSEAYQQDYQNTLDSLKEINANEKDYLAVMEMGLIRDKIFAIITAEVTAETEQVWARHILVEDEEQAKEIYQRLLDGEDFGALAFEFSQDGSAATGGDLGWFGRGRMVAEFEDTAFALEVGEISEPVQSQFGWHIIQVIAHEMRALAASEYEQAKQEYFNTWLADQRANYEIAYEEGWEQFIPSDPDLNAVLQQVFGAQQ